MKVNVNRILISKGENREPALQYLREGGFDVPDAPKECLHLTVYG